MSDSLTLLCLTAVSLGFVHTLLGPDHYLPFVAMAQARGWSLRRTMVITLGCGLGHVLSSVGIGLFGMALGVGVLRLETIESLRGDLAGWLLLTFGLVYCVWGIRHGLRHRPHAHWHAHADGTVHSHEHVHVGGHVHVHGVGDDGTLDALRRGQAPEQRDEATERRSDERTKGRGVGGTKRRSDEAAERSVTPWVLFTIFLFGPCEPLIPLLMYPAAKGAPWHVAIVTAVFGIATLATMTTIVAVMQLGAGSFHLGQLSRYGHAVAGFVILLCGAAVTAGL